MITLNFTYDTKAALERGLARQGQGVLTLTDEDVGAMTPAERGKLPLNRPVSLPEGTVADLLVWIRSQLAEEAESNRLTEKQDAEARAQQLASAQTWSDAVDSCIREKAPLHPGTMYLTLVGLPAAPSSYSWCRDARDVLSAASDRLAEYCRPLLAVRAEEKAAEEKAAQERHAQALADQESADLQWAEAHKDKCHLLTAHVANGVRGALLRKATRRAQFIVELKPFGWEFEQDADGTFNHDEHKYLPDMPVYNALAAAKAAPISAEPVRLQRWRQYVECSHGGCAMCDKDNEHPQYSWVLATEWRGETVIKRLNNNT